MIRSSFLGGGVGYALLRRFGAETALRGDHCSGNAYSNLSKLEVLLGKDIWEEIAGKKVLDFGCGGGEGAIEMAQHGARKVIGLDIVQEYLNEAVQRAKRNGVSDRCVFTTQYDGRVDVILSIDGFEHYGDPGEILAIMRDFLHANGRVFISFGPPWLHPYGGHLFSVFPWAHLIFTEKALIRWRSDFKSDGATRFSEVKGGLNQMTVRRFEKLVGQSDFDIERLEAVPIRRLRSLRCAPTREFFTSTVRCVLRPKSGSGDKRK
ncbi:MAG: class I SAM-dependent methyltransferase [Terriglobia bacterium]